MNPGHQEQLDTRALEIAAATKREVEIFREDLKEHKRICAASRLFMATAGAGIIGFLFIKVMGW